MILRKALPTALLLMMMAVMPAIAGNVTGTVTGGDNKLPLTGANVLVDGTNRGAATDLDGVYVIFNLQPGTYTVRFTMLGYETIERQLTVPEKGGVAHADRVAAPPRNAEVRQRCRSRPSQPPIPQEFARPGRSKSLSLSRGSSSPRAGPGGG